MSTAVPDRERMQHLLDAFLSVSTGLDLEATLRRIVASGMELVEARYGALGVLRADGKALAAFIHVGIPEPMASQMGSLPTGKGVLGELLTSPHPLRIPDLGRHPSAAGLPANHPPMTSFLGVPVLVRGAVFGNLYMTEKEHGEFTAEDQEVLTALAGAAGIAIDNARMYAESEARRRWLGAVADVRAVLLDTDQADPAGAALTQMTDRVRELTEADGAWLLLGPDDDGRYLVTAQSGAKLTDLTGARLTPEDSPVLAAVEAGEGVASLDLSTITYDSPNPHVDWGPCLAIPLRGTHARSAVLVAARTAGADGFDTAQIPFIDAFAAQAAAALDMAARQRLARRLDVFEDRDRIARDLHDHVIQRVFAAGLALQAVIPRVPDEQARQRVRGVIGQLDETVRDIRTTIFDLHTTEDTGAESTRRRLLDVVTETAGGLRPTVRMSGPVDNLLTGDLAADVEAVVREAVSNAARHSGARTVVVTLDVGDDVIVDVADDGRGIDPRVARSGLRNLDQRATRRGGEFSAGRRPEGGTRLRWSAPLR